MSSMTNLTSKLIVLLVSVGSVVACKARTSAFSLKGLTVDETSKEVDYQKLFSKNSISISQIVAYESSYYRRPNSNGASDEGVAAAFKMIWWLKNTARGSLFKGRLIVQQDNFPDSGRQVDLSKMYQFRAKVEGMTVKFGNTTKTINANINIVLGSSISPTQGMEMPDDFRKELARAFINDDIVSYNGHIWTVESASHTNPWVAAPVDSNTEHLAEEMTALGGRKSYGLIYMNACHGEKIENVLMDSMIGTNTDRTVEPILMSHRNYSNYGFFAEHFAKLMVNLFNSQQLPKIILDMTSSIKPAWLQQNGDPTNPAKTLQKYYATPGIRDNPNSVVIVAYDVIRKRAIE